MTVILSIILGLLVLGILVFIHELGHFWWRRGVGSMSLHFSGICNPVFKKTYRGLNTGSFDSIWWICEDGGENPEEPQVILMNSHQR